MFLLAFLGGVLTILSPCILPVIPLVFARSGRSFRRETLPLLAGLALAFTLAALVATRTAQWLLVADEVGRRAALVLLGLVGLSLVSDRVASRLTALLTRLGAGVLERDGRRTTAPSAGRNVVVGGAIGLLWAPCAGPILGLLIAVAATHGGSSAAVLYLAFATGAAMSLAIVLTAGGRALARRRVAGVATLVTVVALAFGWDRAIFARGGLVGTASAEEALIRRFAPAHTAPSEAGQSLAEFAASAGGAAVSPAPLALATSDGVLPSFDGGTEWINSPAIASESLRGKVVLVDFWTFGCYNCLNALPHVKALYAKYRDRGFVVVGVHTPEFAREKVAASVRREVGSLGITYPVVMDNDSRIWRSFQNSYWPAAYFADATGRLRFHHFGEGRYEEQDQVVAKLLDERDAAAAAQRGATR